MTPNHAPTLLDRLRETTREAHDAIERDLGWERRVSTLDGYRDLLCRLHGFHVVWEPAAAALFDDDGFFGPRRKLHLLASDLRHLGHASTEIADLPICCPGVPMRTRADALGAMYVLEGSTLGGQLIARRVAETLGFGADGGCAYYRAYGANIGAMWREFRGRLHATKPEEHEAVLIGAASTFACMHAWLTATPRPWFLPGRS